VDGAERQQGGAEGQPEPRAAIQRPGAGRPGAGGDEVFTRTDAAGARHVLADALGSTLALTDGATAVQTSYTYDRFGATTTSGAASANAAQYTGRENDGTGLYFYRARYYGPALGRFIGEDHGTD
jgi:uncharacterized protein RhaS with RHS repeats